MQTRGRRFALGGAVRGRARATEAQQLREPGCGLLGESFGATQPRDVLPGDGSSSDRAPRRGLLLP